MELRGCRAGGDVYYSKMAASMREKQIVALKRMLNLNGPLSKSSSVEPVWKILVYDRFGQDIISPLLSVRELRELGITLHLLLHSDRDAIPDVPAVYFVMPTDDNVQRICQDFRNQLYESYYLNFISAVSRQRLEEMASATLQVGCTTQISKVYDQNLNFISVEDDMFILRHQNKEPVSYYALNRADVKDTEIEQSVDTIVDSIFAVCVTIGVVPVIRCPKGQAAEMVSEKLDKKIRENLRDTRNTLFSTDSLQSGQISFQRPVLIILDRSIDLATMFHHTWTYQALAHDVVDMKLNRIIIEESPPEEQQQQQSSPHRHQQPKKKKTYDMNASDKFWSVQKGNPFPSVAEAIQEELESYRVSEDEVKRLKSAMGLEGADDEDVPMLTDTTAKLTSAVSSLPELLEKKKLIDMHTNIAMALLNQIKERKLDMYFEMEEKMMSKTSLDKSTMEILNDPEAGSPDDKLRLFLIYYICSETPLPEAEFNSYSSALMEAGCDLNALKYIRRWRTYTKTTAAPSQYGGGGTKTIGMFSKLMSHGSQFVMEGVKNLVVKKHKLPITRIVDHIMEIKSSPDTDDYRYFDPKLIRVTDGNFVPRNKSTVNEAIVFIVGGGNYIEYQNLIDYARNKTVPKKVTYGCTDLVSANQFLKQICVLGSEQ